MTAKKEAAWRGGIAQHISIPEYTRITNSTLVLRKKIDAQIKAALKASIIWFRVHGLLTISVTEGLIRFLHLEAA